MNADQAQELRDRLQQTKIESSPVFVPPVVTARVITVTSGKGGVGKTNFAVNLAIYLAKQNKRVVIVDADFGLANIEVLFGIIPKYSLADVFLGNRRIEDIITEGPEGIKFISGGSGFKSLANLSEDQMMVVINSFTYLESIADIILIDTGAGISNTVLNFVRASNEIILITTPEPTAITDAYALIKSVKDEKHGMSQIKLIINRVDSNKEGLEIFDKLNKVCEQFLTMSLTFLGSVESDSNLTKAVKKQSPAMICYPNSTFSKNLETIGARILRQSEPEKTKQSGIVSFVKRLVNIFDN